MVFELFYQFVETIVLVIKELGYFGIFFGMAIESSLVPFPSEVILIPAGALAATGHMNIYLVLLFGTLGCLMGAFINYYLAFLLGRPAIEFFVSKYGKIFLLNKKNIKKSDLFFEKHGEITTFAGRLVPLVRQLISLPAGFSKMNIFKFAIFTTMGAAIWTAILIYIGYFFGNNLVWLDQNKNLLTSMLFTSIFLVLVSYMVYNRRKKI